uniref:Uncharacterized protein n=1 Tax=Meloidogyne floridensis TaxID=298350 RepID=A0A915NFY9_9BILA
MSSRFDLKKGNRLRLCKECVESGRCEKANSFNGEVENVEWNGILLFYDKEKNVLEVELEMLGKSSKFYLNDITPTEFINGINGRKPEIYAEIKKQISIDVEFEKERFKGALLSDYFGFNALRVDADCATLYNSPGVWYWEYKRNDSEECKEVLIISKFCGPKCWDSNHRTQILREQSIQIILFSCLAIPSRLPIMVASKLINIFENLHAL